MSGEPDEGNNTVTAKDMLTDASGEASIRYTPPEAGGRRTVRASINSGLLKSEVFTINGTPGSGGGGGGGGGGGSDPTNTITISPSSVSGDPGDTETITVSNPAGVLVELSSIVVFLRAISRLQQERRPVSQAPSRYPVRTRSYTIFAVGVNWWCYGFRFSDRYGSNHSIGYPHCF